MSDLRRSKGMKRGKEKGKEGQETSIAGKKGNALHPRTPQRKKERERKNASKCWLQGEMKRAGSQIIYASIIEGLQHCRKGGGGKRRLFSLLSSQ